MEASIKSRAAFIVLLVVLGIALIFGYREHKMAAYLKDDQFSTEPVEVIIGQRGYLVPRNYLRSVSYDQQDGRDIRAKMRALWPGLEPLTQENEHFWERRYPRRQVVMHIVDHGTEGHRRLQNAIKYHLVDSKPRPGPFGLMQYSGKTHRFFVPSNGAYLTPDGNQLVFACKDAKEQTKELFDFEALCTVDYKLPDGAWLYYNFFMVNLEQWREIDRAVRALVESFRRE